MKTDTSPMDRRLLKDWAREQDHKDVESVIDDVDRLADRLATIERRVRELAEHKDRCAEAALACPDSHNQYRVEAEDYQRQAKELRALIDAPEEESSDG